MRSLSFRIILIPAGVLAIAALAWINLSNVPAPDQKFMPEEVMSPAPTQPEESEINLTTAVFNIPRTLRYRFLVTNKTGEMLENARLTMFSPMNLTATQKLIEMKANETFEIVEDKAGNRVMKLVLERMPPYATRVINLEAQLMMANSPQPISAETIGAYLGDGPLFDLDNDEIIKTADSLKASSRHESARSIYDWVKNYLNYGGYIASDRGAAYAMRTQRGDCTEYAYLLAALARLNDIPARIMAGFVYGNNAILRPYDYHNWVEFYVDDRWQIVDPLNNAFFTDKASHVALRVLGGDGELGQLASQKGIEADPRLEIKME